ncbi:MAG: TadA family conjugal transfer-associated ATPase [Actinomycetes bacterium]
MSTVLLERVRTRLADGASDPTPAGVAAALRAEGVVLGDDAVLDLVRTLRHDLAGAGPLEPLLRLPGVTDVLVNGRSSVWIDRGRGLERTDVTFASDESVRRLAQRLAASAGRRLDDAAPCVDARLPSGARLHCVLPPLSAEGTLISLRVPSESGFSVAALVERGAVDAEGADLLRRIVAGRLAFLISGGTGAGKTTVLSALLGLVPADHRIVVVEDSTELAPAHPHVIRLQSRLANVEGAGAVTMRDLVRQALRMRPDRLVVGEVRGAEVVELLAAMNTGHEGGAGTVHANSAADVPARIEALALMAGLERQAVHALMEAGIDVVVHLGRDAGVRVVSGVHVLKRGDDGFVRARAAFTRDDGRLVPGAAASDLVARLRLG